MLHIWVGQTTYSGLGLATDDVCRFTTASSFGPSSSIFDESFQWSSHRLRTCLGRVVRGLGVWCVVAVGDGGGVADKGRGGGQGEGGGGGGGGKKRELSR